MPPHDGGAKRSRASSRQPSGAHDLHAAELPVGGATAGAAWAMSRKVEFMSAGSPYPDGGRAMSVSQLSRRPSCSCKLYSIQAFWAERVVSMGKKLRSEAGGRNQNHTMALYVCVSVPKNSPSGLMLSSANAFASGIIPARAGSVAFGNDRQATAGPGASLAAGAYLSSSEMPSQASPDK